MKNDCGGDHMCGSREEMEKLGYWSQCRYGLLSGSLGQIIHKASVTWTGEGGWTPKHFCITVIAWTTYLTVCKPKPDARLPLTSGQTLALDCDWSHGNHWVKCDDENCIKRDPDGSCLDRRKLDKKCRDKHPLCVGIYTFFPPDT